MPDSELADLTDAPADLAGRHDSEAAGVRAGRPAQIVVDCVPNGLLGIDQAGTITLANTVAGRLFGYETCELLGQPMELLFPRVMGGRDPDLRAAFFANRHAHAMRTCRELLATRKDGSDFAVEIGLNPIHSDGETWVLCSIVDITERKRAAEDLRDNAARMAAVLNTVVDGLITIDEQGAIKSFNPGAERIFGYTEAETLGQNVKFLMPEPYHGMEDGLKSILGAAREVAALRKDGSAFPMDLSLGEMVLHDRRMYVGILRDITERKAVENERLNLIASLKQSNQDLDDFAYIASHDLKEPLRGLFNNALFFKEDYAALVDEAGIKRLDRIFFLCRRMERLIDDLLYFSRLGRQEMAYRETDLNGVVNDILEQLESAFANPGVTVRVEPALPRLVCDATCLGEVFRNLITNAIKYNNKADKLIEIGHLPEYGGSKDVIFVRDNGIGIRPEFQRDIFTIFKRLHPEDDAVRGSGVGLTFAKKIVERHGGHIWLESKVDQGTTFFFTIKKRDPEKGEQHE
jgi:two-component system sensor kinase FixL